MNGKNEVAGIRGDFDLYDMHVHTRYSDGLASPREVLRRARKLGIGIAVTDHNEIRGSVECAEHAGNVKVLPGIEVSTALGVDLLVYFPRIEHLERFYVREVEGHKGVDPSSFTDLAPERLIRAAREHGGLSYLAHPFAYMWKNWNAVLNAMDEKTKSLIHGIEGMNGSLGPGRNRLALALAESMNKPVIGGSDAHLSKRMGKCLTVVPDSGAEGDWFAHLRSGRSMCLRRPGFKNCLYGAMEPFVIFALHCKYWPGIVKSKMLRGRG